MLLMNMIKKTKIFFKKTTRRWKMLQMDIIQKIKIKIKIKIILKKGEDIERYEIL